LQASVAYNSQEKRTWLQTGFSALALLISHFEALCAAAPLKLKLQGMARRQQLLVMGRFDLAAALQPTAQPQGA